jgi:hypothetical protein
MYFGEIVRTMIETDGHACLYRLPMIARCGRVIR